QWPVHGAQPGPHAAHRDDDGSHHRARRGPGRAGRAFGGTDDSRAGCEFRAGLRPAIGRNRAAGSHRGAGQQHHRRDHRRAFGRRTDRGRRRGTDAVRRRTGRWAGGDGWPDDVPGSRRMTTPIISIRKLRREYRAGDEALAVLKDVDLDIHAGEMVAIMGQSGSGKSTLMNVLGCLDDGWTGSYSFAGKDVRKLSPDGLAELRREHFGFIFQRYQLLTELDAVENVEVPAVYAGADRKARRGRASDLLTRLGLEERLSHRPSELSGGQQQRVSVARALMNGGEVILADEPTGALDSRSGTELMALLRELHAEGPTIIIDPHC